MLQYISYHTPRLCYGWNYLRPLYSNGVQLSGQVPLHSMNFLPSLDFPSLAVCLRGNIDGFTLRREAIHLAHACWRIIGGVKFTPVNTNASEAAVAVWFGFDRGYRILIQPTMDCTRPHRRTLAHGLMQGKPRAQPITSMLLYLRNMDARRAPRFRNSAARSRQRRLRGRARKLEHPSCSWIQK
jgi:hypothetical protein